MAGRGQVHEVGAPAVHNRVIPGRNLRPVAMLDGLNVTGSFVQRAREHLRALDGFNGLPAEFEADPRVSKTSGGGATVHMRQQFKSVPVFLGAQAVRFRPDGEVDSSTGAVFTFAQDTPVEPRLTAPQAVLEAARHATQLGDSLLGEPDDFGNALDVPSVDISGFQPKIVASFPEFPTQPTVLDPGPFGHAIKASLTWYPSPEQLQLGWEVILTMPRGAGQYRVIVDANTGRVLYSRQLVDLLTVRGSVYVAEGPPGTRQMTTFPRAWKDYAAGFDPEALPPGVPPEPASWIDETRLDTFGNLVNAHLGDSGSSMSGRNDGDGLVFEPAQADGDDQKVLNIFYYNCYLHNLFYLLGFREEDGNFQLKGIGGAPGDPVDARAHSGAVWGTANMFTPPDGASPVMNMGLVEGTGRHTAFDATVVFHEYMHGVTNRLVGGPMNTKALEPPQSKAMGEGWGDYLACTMTGKNVVGSWVTGKAGGIRSHPYDDDYPGTYGQLGQGIYLQAHKVGEIWCAALMAVNRNLNLRLGQPRGQRLALQLVVDALKLSPANPNMLEMRDAIFSALDHKREASPGLSNTDYEAARAGMWAAFAKFGLGARAQSAGANFGDVVEDFTPGTGGAAPAGGQPANPGTPESPPTPPSAGGTVTLQEAVRVAIPDGNPTGITRVLRADAAGTIKRATLRVDINHPYVGDLVVKLVPPGRPHITLQNQAFQDGPDLVTSYTTDDKLAPLVGQASQGDWMLMMADTSPGDTGALRGWRLELELEGAAGGLLGFAAEAGGSGLQASTIGSLAADANRLLGELESLARRLAGVGRQR